MSVKEGNVIRIPVEAIEPHPNNPRKNVGDVSELADSIKQSGLLQNLTVVPHPDKSGRYRALIGHRRLAAAKQAGLEFVPCVVMEDMSLAEQVAIMVAENMQRQDLTIPEQVESIQLMIDLGMSVEEVSEKTGLGKSTVYKRRALSAFESAEFKKSAERGGTLQDYMKVAALKDEKAREKVLKAVGTNNFNMELNTALNEEKKQERCELIESKLNEWAKKVESTKDMSVSLLRWVSFGYDIKEDDEKLQKPDKDCEYVYVKGYSDYAVYEVKFKSDETPQKTPEQLAREKKEQERLERKRKFEELENRMKELRRSYVLNFTLAVAEKKILEIGEGLIRLLTDAVYFDEVEEAILKLYGAEEENKEEVIYGKNTALSLFYALYTVGESEADLCRNRFYGTYSPDKEMLTYYEILEKLGYQISDEEQSYLDGTHELYVKEG
ncbi:MAG: ParB/RepB/Spo0J family partition protein [Clostridia bacterium]|nr:ParB/RepB/Spo0J family partition protein [Clostridia bacterium]